jgi:hypothetical protein
MSMLPLIPHRLADALWDQVDGHVTQGSGKKIGRQGCNGTGEVCRESLPDRRLMKFTASICSSSGNFRNATFHDRA